MLSTRAIVAATLVFSPLTGALHAGVLAHWSFDADFTDSSTNANHLTSANGTPVITNTTGDFKFGGGALDLDYAEKEFLDLTTEINLSDTDAWSISFWGKRRVGADNRAGMVLGDNTTNATFIWTPDNPSQVKGLRFRSSTNANANYGTFDEDNQFHHWVVIADGAGNIQTYRDNVDLGVQSLTTSFNINTVASAYGTSNVHRFDGQLDEIYIFDEAIDAQTVEALFNSNTLPTLVGDFDGDGDIDGVDIAEMFANFNGPGGGVPANTATDLDGDGDVDGVDLATLFGNFTGPLAPAAVPEPAGLALIGLGGLLLSRRRPRR